METGNPDADTVAVVQNPEANIALSLPCDLGWSLIRHQFGERMTECVKFVFLIKEGELKADCHYRDAQECELDLMFAFLLVGREWSPVPRHKKQRTCRCRRPLGADMLPHSAMMLTTGDDEASP